LRERLKAAMVVASVAVLAGLLVAPSVSAKFRGAPDSKLQHAIEAIVDDPGGPPGVSVLIDRGAHTEFLQAGTADVRNGRPPTPFDAFRIASVSKGFNAYLAAKLIGNGALSLETTLREKIPGVLPAAEGVKLRELLQHTSGLPEYIQTKAFGEQLTADPARYFSPIQLTEFVRDEPLEFEPGSKYHYSDTDNIAAALIEEEVSGLLYPQLLARRIFGPLKMRDSSLPVTTKMPRPFLHGYDVEAGKKPEDVSELINPAGAWASGGIVSTPLDMARFARRYVPTVLATATVEGPFRRGSSSPPGPGKNFAGLGLFRYRTGCGTVYGHTGSFPGYRVFLASSSNGKRSVVFVANSQITPGGQGNQKVAKAITRAQARAVCRALG
jgi:D-alanyl-D-alanine carboxypeptidase